MKTPIFSLMTTGGPSTTATNFASLSGASNNTYQTTAANRCSRVPRAGTISRLFVYAQTALTQGSYTITLQKATPSDTTTALSFSDTTITLTLDSAGQAQANSDLVHTVTAAAGDVFSLKFVPSGGTAPSNIGMVAFSLQFESDETDKGLIMAGHRSGSVAGFMAFGSYSGSGAAQADCNASMPTAGVIDRMYVGVSSAPGAGLSRTFTVLKNGSATALTVTIADTNLRGSITGQNVSFAENDVVVIEETVSGAIAAAQVSVALDWDPTTSDEAVQFATATSAPSNAAANYYTGCGTGLSSTEASQLVVAPCDFTAKKLHAVIATAPGSGKSRVFALRQNGASQALTTTLSDAEVADNDNTNTVSITSADRIGVVTTPSGTPTATATSSVSWVAVVAAAAAAAPRNGLLLRGVG